jgi:hypothetical protein
MKNGHLGATAEHDGVDLLMTTDHHLRDHQNRATRQIAMRVLTSTSWPPIQGHVSVIRQAIAGRARGRFTTYPAPRVLLRPHVLLMVQR